jgi:hypothetical protein
MTLNYAPAAQRAIGKREGNEIAQLLEALAQGPRLVTDLPKFPNALMVAESMGLCSAQCLERGKFTATSNDRATWQWNITQKGRIWLKRNT